jgi:hypothetical protein
VRRADDAVEAEERVVRRGRLLLEDVERRATDVAGGDRVGERALVHEPTAGAVHEQHPLLHPRDRRSVHDVPRLIRQRDVERDHVRLAPELVEIDLRHPEPGRASRLMKGRRR